MLLLTSPTPNAWKVSIMVEELRGFAQSLEDLTVEMIDLLKGDQFAAVFVSVNPNSKIPAMADGVFNLMESCVVLQYLGEKFPSPLWPLEYEANFEVIQWIDWQAANVGPVLGNKLSYTRYMEEVEPVAKAHSLRCFATEAKRLMGVLSRRLEGRDFVCGEQFTIAAVVLYPWATSWKWSKIPILGIRNLEVWVDRVRARPTAECGFA